MKDLSHQQNPLRVVVLNDSSVAKGGATGLATLSARMLADRGIPTTFIAGDAGDEGDLAADGVDLLPLGGKLLLDAGVLKSLRTGIYNTAIRDQVANHIAQSDTPGTVYHLHGWSRILSPAILDALAPVAKRTFIHAHDFFLGCPNGAFFDFRKKEICSRTPLSMDCLKTACDRRAYHHKLWRAARGMMLRRTFDKSAPWAGVFTLHPGMAEPLIRAGVPEALMTTLRNPAKPLHATRIRAEDNRTFCFIGRLETGKGINTLCAAARLAGVPLRVIGDGAEEEALRQSYPEFSFTGWVPQAEIGTHLSDVRALVMPSRTPEPFGLVAAEASASGLPVILSKQALLSQDFEAHRLGFAADTQTPTSLAKHLTRMAEMPGADVKDLSERAHACTAGIALSPDAWVDHLVTHYSAAITDQPTHR